MIDKSCGKEAEESFFDFDEPDCQKTKILQELDMVIKALTELPTCKENKETKECLR